MNLNCSFFALFLRSKRLYGLFWGEVTKNITNCTITELRIKFDVILFCISQWNTKNDTFVNMLFKYKIHRKKKKPISLLLTNILFSCSWLQLNINYTFISTDKRITHVMLKNKTKQKKPWMVGSAIAWFTIMKLQIARLLVQF